MLPIVLKNHGADAESAFLRLADQSAVWVQVNAVEGSVPREVGAWMAVFDNATFGTVGGGHLEYKAIAVAREFLNSDSVELIPKSMRFALGPALGQCCGGVVELRFEAVRAADVPALRLQLGTHTNPVTLFGGGHVGHALVYVLSALPFALTWIDSRDGIFPDDLPLHVVCEHSNPVEGAVQHLAPHSQVLIMSFSHAEDLEVLAACLLRHRQHADLPYIGLIGSKTKWAAFRSRLLARGFTPDEMAHVTCPIGVAGISGKQPEVVAVAVAAQLLQLLASG